MGHGGGPDVDRHRLVVDDDRSSLPVSQAATSVVAEFVIVDVAGRPGRAALRRDALKVTVVELIVRSSVAIFVPQSPAVTATLSAISSYFR